MPNSYEQNKPNHRLQNIAPPLPGMKPQILALADLTDFQKPSMEMHIAGASRGEKGCACNPVCTCVPVESCACDQVCSCDKVCACENVCGCVGHRSCTFVICTCNKICICVPVYR